MVFIFISFLGQIYIGNHVLRNDFGFIAYPLLSLLLGSLYWLIPKKLKINEELKKIEKEHLILILILFLIIAWSLNLFGNYFVHFGIYQNMVISIIPLMIYSFFNCQQIKQMFFITEKSLFAIGLIGVIYFGIAIGLNINLNHFWPALWENLIVAAIPEEIVFRFLLLGSLLSLKKTNDVNSILLSALIFGFWHLPINIENIAV